MGRLYLIVLGGALCIGGAFWAGWALHQPPAVGSLSLRQSDVASTTYQFIDPLLAVRNPDGGNSPAYNPALDKVTALVADARTKHTLQTASVYFRDMGPSQGFILNGDEQYSPASLLKVPTMMSYLKLSESAPATLNTTATYSGAHDANGQEHIKSSVQLAAGTYTIRALLESMIKHSDNNAAETLIGHLTDSGDTAVFSSLFTDLGISRIDLGDDFITVRAYALFFRVLYNATYLNRTNSERALGLLAETDFNDGLRAGVPAELLVAHKFGEFSLENQNGVLLKRELHDCGIVYYPRHPYLLCIMTKGSDFAELEGVIKELSQTVYEFMAAKYPR